MMDKFQVPPLHITKLTLFSFILFALNCHGWHLAQIGLNETYRVRHLSLYFTRVFLSIETPSRSFPTLIESNWPENFVPLRSDIYPDLELHANGNHSDCTLIQQAIWTQVDNLGRLWVMDMGWHSAAEVCSPKLLVFDLLRNNVEVLRIDCSRYFKPNDARLLVVKLGPPAHMCKIEKYVYFILADDAHILAYDIIEQKWLQHSLVSSKYKDIINAPFPIKPIDIAFGSQGELLFSDADGQLYVSRNALLLFKQPQVSTLSNDIRNVSSNDNVDVASSLKPKLELELLGSLLGPSKGMMVEQHTGALFYAMSKFGAVVRCMYHSNLTAEDNEIIYFTSKNIQQIFFGIDNGVWLLTNRTLLPNDHCFANI